MMKRLLSFTLACLFLWGLFGFGTASAAPRIGLVLSGGGARGAAHVGVLKVLEELRIPIHAIAGTSMGSLVGGAYASGLSATELENAIGGIDWSQLLNDDPPRSEWPMRRKQAADTPTWDFSIGNRDGKFRLPSGALAGQQVQLFFSDLVKSSEGRQGDFDNLPIPFRAVATDLENGRMKVFNDGDLPVAMRASMSVPGLFSPMETGGNLYVDGGLVRNLPVDVVRTMGVDAVIAVNLGSSYLPRDELGTVLGVTAQMVAILTEQNVEASLAQLDGRRDLLIKPELGDISSGDFKRSQEAIAVGEKAARAMAKQLRRFSVSERAYAAWRGKVEARRAPVKGEIDEVRVAGTERVNPGVFDTVKENHSGEPLDREGLEQDIQSVYARGDFERISYRLSRDDSLNLLIVDAVEKSWGPGYLSFGIGMSTDFQGDSRMGVRGLYRQTWVNELGAEWTTELTIGNEPNLYTEFYQPLTLDGSLFVAPYLDASQVPLSVYVDDQRVARYDVSRLRAGVDLGATFGKSAELRAGIYAGVTDFDVDTGDLLLPEGSNADSGVKLGFVYDTLDSRFVPTDGQRFVVQAFRPMPALGADVEYTRLSATWLGAHGFGDNVLVGALRGGTSFGDVMPYYDQFPLGGFMKLGGYANEQFRGNDYAYAGLAYYRQIAELTPPLGRGVYAGATLEAGRFFDTDLRSENGEGDLSLSPEKTRYSAGLFLGADTWAGPLYLGWGISGEGDNAFYALIGRP